MARVQGTFRITGSRLDQVEASTRRVGCTVNGGSSMPVAAVGIPHVERPKAFVIFSARSSYPLHEVGRDCLCILRERHIITPSMVSVVCCSNSSVPGVDYTFMTQRF